MESFSPGCGYLKVIKVLLKVQYLNQVLNHLGHFMDRLHHTLHVWELSHRCVNSLFLVPGGRVQMRCNVSLSSCTWWQVRAECNCGGCEGSWEKREKGEIESCALPANSCRSSCVVDFSPSPASCSSGYFAAQLHGHAPAPRYLHCLWNYSTFGLIKHTVCVYACQNPLKGTRQYLYKPLPAWSTVARLWIFGARVDRVPQNCTGHIMKIATLLLCFIDLLINLRQNLTFIARQSAWWGQQFQTCWSKHAWHLGAINRQPLCHGYISHGWFHA